MKKFLGRLFGAKVDEESQRLQKQRSPRVRIPSVEGAVFVSHDGKSFPLHNISESGLALLSPGHPFPDETWGEIRLATERVAVRLKTVRRNGDEAGAVIADGAAGVRALLRRVFTDEFKALEMTEVESERQKAVELGTPKWFYAPGHFELFYVIHEGRLLRFEIEWNGNVLALSGEGTLRHGTIDREARDDVSHAKSDLVSWSAQVTDEHKRKALRLIENVPGLEADVRAQLRKLLE